MVHVDYAGWYEYIVKIAARFPPPSTDVLELGGGTAKLSSYAQLTGKWRWFCTDVNPAMLQVAKNGRKNSFVQDAQHLATSHHFGLIVFLYDGINYLRTRTSFVAALREIKGALLQKGYFLFDVTTESNSKRHFADLVYFEEGGNYCFVRHATYDARKKTQRNRFDIFSRLENGTYERTIESHHQKVYSIKEIRAMIKESGLKLLHAWDGYGFRKASASSDRIHFLVQRP